jgi:hypothetical protein
MGTYLFQCRAAAMRQPYIVRPQNSRLILGKIFVSLPPYFGKIQINIYGKFFNETVWYKSR